MIAKESTDAFPWPPVTLPTLVFELLELCVPAEPVLDDAPRYLLIEVSGPKATATITNGIVFARVAVAHRDSPFHNRSIRIPWDTCRAVRGFVKSHHALQCVVQGNEVLVGTERFSFEPSVDNLRLAGAFNPESGDPRSGKHFSICALMQITALGLHFSPTNSLGVVCRGAPGDPAIFQVQTNEFLFEATIWPGVEFPFVPPVSPCNESTC